MTWQVASTGTPGEWRVGTTAWEDGSFALSGEVADFIESVGGTASAVSLDIFWSVGTSSGGVWSAGSSQREITFGVWPYEPYRHSESCLLGVIGVGATYTITWSPAQLVSHPDAVQLTVVSDDINDGAGTVTVTAERGNILYGQAGWLFVTSDGESSEGIPVILQLEAGKQMVQLVEPLVPPQFGVWAISDLVGGDYLIWWNPQPEGAVTVHPNRAFVTDGTVNEFDVEGYIPGVGYTNTEVQDINFGPDPELTADLVDYLEVVAGSATFQPTGSALTSNIQDYLEDVAGTATIAFSRWVSGVPITNCAGDPLANQTNINYALLPGHNVWATEPIVHRTDGTTDEQGMFEVRNIVYPENTPVTLIMRWMEGPRDRYVVLYTQLTRQ